MSPREPRPDRAQGETAPGESGEGGDYSRAARISRHMVQLMSRYTGRGPTKARTVLNTSFALVVLEDTLTKGERNLVAAGEHASVLTQRRAFQTLMRDEAIAAVEEISGRRVRAYLSDFSPEGGIAVEVFLFEASAEPGAGLLAEAQVAGPEHELD